MILKSRYNGVCKKCDAPIFIGDPIGWQPGEKGVWCLRCVPDHVKAPPKTQKPDTTDPHWKKSIKMPKVDSGSTTTFLKALGLLEDALIERAMEPSFKMTDDLEKQWARYNKIKALALQPGTTAEGRVALKTALVKVIDLVF